jgi:hypothetical protein
MLTPLIVENFDADTLKELRENARVYQKLDLAYLAAGGAIVTALKLHNNALFEFGARLWIVVVAFLILFAADTFIEQFVFGEWIAAKINAKKRHTMRSVVGALGVQPFLHLIFVSGVIAGVLGYSMGVTSVQDERRAQAGIQDATESFIVIKRRPPASIEELIAVFPFTSHFYDILKHQPIHFETDNKDKYRIIFAGEDAVIGTTDDKVVTSAFKLRMIDDIEAEGSK